MTQRRDTFESIQYLRGLAAIMIVAYHVRPRLERMGWEGSWPEWLSAGVDIFFVISGFIMWTTTWEREPTPFDFLLRRFLRIAPLYYIVTALTVSLMLVAPKLAVSGEFDIVHVIASFAFFPTLHPVLHTFLPVLPQGWTLNCEMEFYALFALMLFMPEPKRRWMIPLALAAIVVLGHNAADNTAASFYTSSMILEFGFGVLLGVAVTRGIRLSAWSSAQVFVLGAVDLVAAWPMVEGGFPRVLASGVPAALIVSGAVFFELQRAVRLPPIFKLLGDASYSMYLTHGLFLTAIGVLWVKAGLAALPFSNAVFIAVAVACAAAGGIGVYFAIERPLHRYSAAVMRKKRHPVPA